MGIVDGQAIFRVAKPGKNYDSTDLDDFTIHESHVVYRGLVRGAVAFAAAGSADIAIAGISGPYFVSISASDGTLPCYIGPYWNNAIGSVSTYFATLVNDTTLRIINSQNVARTIQYTVFGNRLNASTAV